MKKVFLFVLSLLTCIGVLCDDSFFVYAMDQQTFTDKVEAFVHDPRWKDWTHWDSYQTPKISPSSGNGCYAYAADFVKYVFDVNYISNGKRFTDATEIREGDVLHFESDAGESHWIAIISVNGTDAMYCDGNSGDHVTVGDWVEIHDTKTVYGITSITGNYMIFKEGYHFEEVKGIPENAECKLTIKGEKTENGYRIFLTADANKLVNMNNTIHICDEFGQGDVFSLDMDVHKNHTTTYDFTYEGGYRDYRVYKVEGTSEGLWHQESIEMSIGEDHLMEQYPLSTGAQDLGAEFDALLFFNYDNSVLAVDDEVYTGYNYGKYCMIMCHEDAEEYIDAREVPDWFVFHFKQNDDGSYIISTSDQKMTLSYGDTSVSLAESHYVNWNILGKDGEYYLSVRDNPEMFLSPDIYPGHSEAEDLEAGVRVFDSTILPYGNYDWRRYSLGIRILGQAENTVHPHQHDFDSWNCDSVNRKHYRICRTDSYREIEKCVYDDGVEKDGIIEYTCQVCGGKYTSFTAEGISRAAGNNRYETSLTIAETYRKKLKIDKFDCVILACGTNFADALAGSYLSALRNAPILITSTAKAGEINRYIKQKLKKNGTIYVLGGTAAVPDSCLKGLSDFAIKRFAGRNRYETNRLILEETGYDTDTFILATGSNFADSLSASACGLPIVLTKEQYTMSLDMILFNMIGKKAIILGGEKAVTSEIESFLSGYDIKAERIAGANRYETSALIAEYFSRMAKCGIIAYAGDFPDGLCGGPLAYRIGAPLLLTGEGKDTEARHFMRDHGIKNGYVLGGTARLSDKLVRKVFYLREEDPIKSVNE